MAGGLVSSYWLSIVLNWCVPIRMTALNIWNFPVIQRTITDTMNLRGIYIATRSTGRRKIWGEGEITCLICCMQSTWIQSPVPCRIPQALLGLNFEIDPGVSPEYCIVWSQSKIKPSKLIGGCTSSNRKRMTLYELFCMIL